MAVIVPGTTVGAARNNIVAAIQAQPACLANAARPAGQAPVLVQLDDIGRNKPEEYILVHNARATDLVVQMVGNGGQGWMDEEYTIDVLVSCYRGGNDPKSVFDRAVTLVDAVCTAVRQDPTLGLADGAQPAGMGYVIWAHPARLDWKTAWAENNQGRIADCDIEIAVRARL